MILIAIPTYKRIKKLQRLLRSLERQTYKDWEAVAIVDNNDMDTVVDLKYLSGHIKVLVQPEHKFVIGAWNRAIKEVFDLGSYNYFCGLCDDVELEPDTLEQAVKKHKQNFLDGDGVIGLNQDCPGHPNYTFKWFGQTLMGRKFIRRYGDNDLCCPDYKHFYQDEEMWEFAKSNGLIAICPEALIHHYHPSFILDEVDETHGIIRIGPKSPKDHDIKMRAERKARNYLWGRDFNLVGEL